uniref:Galectin n=1 Tax=Meloidogyne javanica TaxID=6303 RepID=A0A915LCF8_MELJA
MEITKMNQNNINLINDDGEEMDNLLEIDIEINFELNNNDLIYIEYNGDIILKLFSFTYACFGDGNKSYKRNNIDIKILKDGSEIKIIRIKELFGDDPSSTETYREEL